MRIIVLLFVFFSGVLLGQNASLLKENEEVISKWGKSVHVFLTGIARKWPGINQKSFLYL